ncbi:MAG: acyl-CoA carboxylase subunit beta, partial [Ignavibacteriales bacterium]|nr:acyl-CoA carboxylase subunit beta [Ignavibacteriales bacterium]
MSIGTKLNKDLAFTKHAEAFLALQKKLAEASRRVKQGGGAEAMARHRKKGKLFARDRIEKLIDPQSRFLEIGLFAAHGMYEEYGGAPSAGTVFGVGTIHGREVVIVANDATVKAGAWFP